jgi:hypothetical protein
MDDILFKYLLPIAAGLGIVMLAGVAILRCTDPNRSGHARGSGETVRLVGVTGHV